MARVRLAAEEAGSLAKARQEEALAKARAQADEELKKAISDVEEIHVMEQRALIEAAEATAKEAKEHADIELARQLQMAEETSNEKLRRSTQTLAAVQETLQETKKQVQEYKVQLQTAEKTRVETARMHVISLENLEKESDRRLQLAHNQLTDKHREEMERCLANAAAEADAILQETQAAFRVERDRMIAEAEARVASAVAEEQEQGTARCAIAREEGHQAGLADGAEKALQELAVHEAAWRAQETNLNEKIDAARAHLKVELALRQQEWEAKRAQELALQEGKYGEARNMAIKLEIAKWEKKVQDMEERAEGDRAAAFARGVEERDTQAKTEMDQLRGSLERAMADIKAGAQLELDNLEAKRQQDLLDCEERVKAESLSAAEESMRVTRQLWDEERKVETARTRAATLLEARAQADKDKRAAIEAAKQREALHTEKVKEELRQCKTAWASEKRELLQKAENSMREAEKATEGAKTAALAGIASLQRARAKWEEGQMAALTKAADSASSAQDKALRELRRSLGRERLRSVEEAIERERTNAAVAIEELRRSSESALGTAKGECEALRAVQVEMAAKVTELEDLLRRKELELSTATSDSAAKSVANSLELWRWAVSSMRSAARQKAQRAEMERGALAERRADQEAAKLMLTGVLEDAAALLESEKRSREHRAEMRNTLVNHKREVLVDHRLQSTSLRKQVEQLARERDAVEMKRDEAKRKVGESERAAREAEHELQTHARQSVIGPDGRVSIAHQRKKRRLDEDLEEALKIVEACKATEASMEEHLRELAEARMEKEEEMKQLERELVSVLVEQQKKLLATLAEAAESDESMDEVIKRIKLKGVHVKSDNDDDEY